MVRLEDAFNLLRHDAELRGKPRLRRYVAAVIRNLDVEKLQQPVCEFDMLPGPKHLEPDVWRAP